MPVKQVLIEIGGEPNDPASAKLLPAFQAQFGATQNPMRFWVPGRDWLQRVEALWDATFEPNGIPAEITAKIGWDRAMTEGEWQSLIQSLGIEESCDFSVVATDWGTDIVCAGKLGCQTQDGFKEHPVGSAEDAELWVFPE